jgi:hypothetical protein
MPRRPVGDIPRHPATGGTSPATSPSAEVAPPVRPRVVGLVLAAFVLTFVSLGI